MRFCLSKSEIRYLIDEQLGLLSIIDPTLKAAVENSRAWLDELISMNYLFAQVLERKKKMGQDCATAIARYHTSADEMYFGIQEHTPEFLDYMLKNVSDRDLSLEDRLIRIQTNLSNHEYFHTVHM